LFQRLLSLHPYRQRTERVIAVSRLVLAASSLVALELDPTEPRDLAAVASVLVATYLLYAVILLGVVWWLQAPFRGFRTATHAIDLAFFTGIMYFTEGSTSPFFVFFVFALVVANLRWGALGTEITAAVSLAAYVALGYLGSQFPTSLDFELNRFVIRAVYLAILVVLLAQFDRYQESLRKDLAQLAHWRRPVAPDVQALLRAALPEAMAVVGARRALVLWDDAEEPWRYVARQEPTGFEFSREAPDRFGRLVPESLEDAAFVWISRTAKVERLRDGKVISAHSEGIDAELRSAFSMDDFVSAPLRGKDMNGRVFFLETPAGEVDSLFTVEIVAAELVAGIDEVNVRTQLQRATALRERMRTSVDLHDGVLQSLTAVGLELAVLAQTLPEDLVDVRARLARVRGLLSEEQRDLRTLIDEMRVQRPADPSKFDLVGHLGELRDRTEQQWGLEVRLEANERALALCSEAGARFERQVYYLLHEGLVNVARHAEASHAELSLQAGDGDIRIRIIDDGRGFPMRGRYDLDDLGVLGTGPAALSMRVRGLRGTMVLQSDDSGSCIDIDLPIAEL
jgi:signal transduction histidine kinase